MLGGVGRSEGKTLVMLVVLRIRTKNIKRIRGDPKLCCRKIMSLIGG